MADAPGPDQPLKRLDFLNRPLNDIQKTVLNIFSLPMLLNVHHFTGKRSINNYLTPQISKAIAQFAHHLSMESDHPKKPPT